MTRLLVLYILLTIRGCSSSQAENSRVIRSSPVLPGPLNLSQRSLAAIKIDPSGRVYTTQILKQQLANELGLPLRDLRIVDPSYPSQIQATFTARKKAILFCIENIKVVVQHNEALVFGPLQPEVQEFVPALQLQIEQAAENFGWAGSVRFEHIVLEAALSVVCSDLLRRVRALSPAVSSALKGLRAESRGLEVIQTQADELLPLKNKIDELKTRVKEVKRAITEILSNDEDMGMMYLSNNPISDLIDISNNDIDSSSSSSSSDSISNSKIPSGSSPPYLDPSKVPDPFVDTMNLEMLFENYLNEIEWIASEVEEVIDEITNTEENVVLQLDILRNRILRFELSLSMSSFVVTCGALITGLFGMNLTSHLETDKNIFYIVTAAMVAGMAATWVQFARYGRNTFGKVE